MSSRMIPAFRDGDYSSGIVDGVIALDAMARQKPLPEPPNDDWWIEYLLMALAILLLIAVIMSIVKHGRQGWGWKLIVLIFTLLGAILTAWWMSGRHRHRSSGGGRRGSFGGGRSGGGGATGSW